MSGDSLAGGTDRADLNGAKHHVLTVAELRRSHVVLAGRVVVHSRSCHHARSGLTEAIGDDPRYWRGELRSGECCGAYVPLPDAPPDVPGWNHSTAYNIEDRHV